MRYLILVTCVFLGHLYAHTIVITPDPMNLVFGGPDGTIKLTPDGDEPTPDCQIIANARPLADDLISISKTSTQPAPAVVLTVHALRQPQGQSESTAISGSWSATKVPIAACSAGPFSFGFTVTVTPGSIQPSIPTGGAISASSYGAFSSITSGGFVEIYGSNLATGTADWGTSFVNGVAPTSLSGVSVQIDNKPAFVNFVSAGQVNVLAPDNLSAGGTVMLTLTNSNGTSAPIAVRAAAVQPGLLAPDNFKINGKQYVTAFLPDGNYALPTGALGSSRPARPGEVIVMYGLGFGPVSPAVLSGTLATEATTLRNSLQMSFGGAGATVQYDGLAPMYSGLYQFNVQVPAVADGDAVPLTFSLGGVPGGQTLYIAVKAQ